MMYPRPHCPVTGMAPFAGQTSETFRILAGWIARQNSRFRRTQGRVTDTSGRRFQSPRLSPDSRS